MHSGTVSGGDAALSLRKLAERLAAAILLFWNIFPALTGSTFAHDSGVATSEVTLTAEVAHYRLKVPIHDLALALGVEGDSLNPDSAAEADRRHDEIRSYVIAGLHANSQDGRCTPSHPELDYRGEAGEVVLDLSFRCARNIESLRIRYSLFFEIDPFHINVGVARIGTSEERFVVDASYPLLDLNIDELRSKPLE